MAFYSQFSPAGQVANVKAAATNQPLPYPATTTSISSPPSSGGDDWKKYIADAYNKMASQNAQLQKLMAQQYRPPVAANFNISQNWAKARSQAEAAVNPLYVKKLNDFLERQKVELARKNEDIARSNSQLEEILKNAMESSDISRTRTSEDVTKELSNIADTQQNFQQDTGQQYDQARSALQGNLAQSGLTTSGLGQQQLEQANTQQNIEEGRQVKSFNMQKETQQLFRTRTFEDLARSDVLQKRKESAGKELNKIDLDRYIQDQVYNEAQTRQQLEAQRMQDVLQQSGSYAKQGLADFLATIKDAGVRQATAQTYGGLI